MKQIVLLLFIGIASVVKAQKIDSIYVNLYTDSLKRGTYNYINIDGLLHNGRYLPLDSTHLTFTASAGQFKGNNLWIDKDFKDKKVSIKVVLKDNPSLCKEFEIYIKQKPDNEKLKTSAEILDEIKHPAKKTVKH